MRPSKVTNWSAGDLCFHVNPVGAIIWQTIGDGASLSVICARLVDAFPGLAPEVAARDAESFINQLIDHQLIVLQVVTS